MGITGRSGYMASLSLATLGAWDGITHLTPRRIRFSYTAVQQANVKGVVCRIGWHLAEQIENNNYS